jgi:hypothetical protein
MEFDSPAFRCERKLKVAQKQMFKKPHRQGAACPAYCFTSILEIFRRYEKELVGKYVADPLGTRVWFMDYNFPKLIQLQYRGNKANATKALEYFRSASVITLKPATCGHFKTGHFGWSET